MVPFETSGILITSDATRRTPYLHVDADNGLAGLYTIEKEVGNGATGRVFRAHNVSNPSHAVAIKSMRKAAMSDLWLRRCKAECYRLYSLKHDNIVALEEVIEDHEHVHAVMQFVDGRDLENLLMTQGAPMKERDARLLFYQLCSALVYLHESDIVHRDVKPKNIIIDSQTGRPFLCDFGLSTAVRPERGARARAACGTLIYAAPEVFTSGVYLGPEIDVWSAGITLYAMLTCAVPFWSATQDKSEIKSKIRRGVYTWPGKPCKASDAAKDLVARMLNVDPKKRATLAEVMQHKFFGRAILKQALQAGKEREREREREREWERDRDKERVMQLSREPSSQSKRKGKEAKSKRTKQSSSSASASEVDDDERSGSGSSSFGFSSGELLLVPSDSIAVREIDSSPNPSSTSPPSISPSPSTSPLRVPLPPRSISHGAQSATAQKPVLPRGSSGGGITAHHNHHNTHHAHQHRPDSSSPSPTPPLLTSPTAFQAIPATAVAPQVTPQVTVQAPAVVTAVGAGGGAVAQSGLARSAVQGREEKAERAGMGRRMVSWDSRRKKEGEWGTWTRMRRLAQVDPRQWGDEELAVWRDFVEQELGGTWVNVPACEIVVEFRRKLFTTGNTGYRDLKNKVKETFGLKRFRMYVAGEGTQRQVIKSDQTLAEAVADKTRLSIMVIERS